MLLGLALAAAVAGGQLGVTMAPSHPHPGRRVVISMTGQVGGQGRLYVYRNPGRSCAASARGERRRGRRVAAWRITHPFVHELGFTPRRAGTQWVCVYLYAITCDASGRDCAPALGLPPDAGFAQVRVRVRPRSHSASSAAGSGRVIT